MEYAFRSRLPDLIYKIVLMNIQIILGTTDFLHFLGGGDVDKHIVNFHRYFFHLMYVEKICHGNGKEDMYLSHLVVYKFLSFLS